MIPGLRNLKSEGVEDYREGKSSSRKLPVKKRGVAHNPSNT
jgi:hypothetical protein